VTPPDPAKRPVEPIAVYYLRLLPALQAAARGLGYALALHGSMSRDLDLVAVPWVAEAAHPRVLAEAVRAAAGGHWSAREDGDYHREGCPGAKPHGRLCWSVHLGAGAYLDLSVVPPALAPAPHRFNAAPAVLRRCLDCGAYEGMTSDGLRCDPSRLDGRVEPCCECGADYPRRDLIAGEVFCGACRAAAARPVPAAGKSP
jgi:hypothetical protein